MYQPIDIGFWNNWTYNEYIHSEAWKSRKADAIRKAGYQCQHPGCNSYNKLEVHHKTYIRLGRELDNDLICLCKNHHKKYHEEAVEK